jgi:hypothetical protein
MKMGKDQRGGMLPSDWRGEVISAVIFVIVMIAIIVI